jgi:uncharacterized protein (TIGR03435 family)
MSNRRAPSIGLAAALLACLPASPLVLHAQASASVAAASPPPTYAYDVVSIKRNKSGSVNVRFMVSESGINLTNTDAANLIAGAYSIKPDLISGLPHWSDSTRFDVEAKMSSDDVSAVKKLDMQHRESTRKSMEQALLTDRFKLKAHVEVKQLPVYDLVISKGGLKIKEYDPAASHPDTFKGPDGKPMLGMTHGSPTSFSGQAVTIGTLTSFMEYHLHRSVVDKTGLTGKYDIQLTWAPDRDTPPDPSAADTAPSLFTAFEEQLGLKLQPGKGPVDTLVVDQIEQPSEN